MTMPVDPVDVAELRRLAEAATAGPWAWTGHDDGCVDLTTKHRGHIRVVSAMRARPCIVALADRDPGLTDDACDDCRRMWAKWELALWWNERRERRGLPEWGDSYEVWGDYRCPRPENLATVWLRDHDSTLPVVAPANRWAVRQRDYRSDVARVDHPDAAYLAAASPDVLVSVLDRLEAAEARVRELEAEAAGMDEAYETVVATNRRLHMERDEAVLRLRAATTSEVLWEGETLPTYRETHTMTGPALLRGSVLPRVDVPPGTRVAVVVAPVVAGEPDSTPAAEEVRDA